MRQWRGFRNFLREGSPVGSTPSRSKMAQTGEALRLREEELAKRESEMAASEQRLQNASNNAPSDLNEAQRENERLKRELKETKAQLKALRDQYAAGPGGPDEEDAWWDGSCDPELLAQYSIENPPHMPRRTINASQVRPPQTRPPEDGPPQTRPPEDGPPQTRPPQTMPPQVDPAASFRGFDVRLLTPFA
ncbi:hypothetical protein K431DRAFT_138290 [Polychaeton citri CBS 116435]|uniref:Uncharacterized protein n=1 Tax=Polychaeton citri CBS 116435 TaxID=1314669 RepID=A0A9P4Q4H2_9PEZI|nr:hypothetical protein K431DRAFT_138290 [Polychaeton citri CBS 116435]